MCVPPSSSSLSCVASLAEGVRPRRSEVAHVGFLLFLQVDGMSTDLCKCGTFPFLRRGYSKGGAYRLNMKAAARMLEEKDTKLSLV